MDTTSLKATNRFYAGKQRIPILSLREVRALLICLAVYCCAATFVFLSFGAEYGEVFDFSFMLLVFVPVVVSVVGGISRAAWSAYAGFAALTIAGMAAYALTSRPISLLPLLPAAGFLFHFNRLAPQVLREFRITGRLSLVRELPVALIMAVALPFMAYRLIASYDSIIVRNLAIPEIAYYSITCALLFVPMLGVTYGIVARRLLSLNFQLIIPILINTAAFSLFYAPTTLAFDASVLVLVGNTLCTFAIQMILGLGFYYSRTTRFLFLAYLFFYIIYKSVGAL